MAHRPPGTGGDRRLPQGEGRHPHPDRQHRAARAALPIGTDAITATAVSRQVSALAAVLHTPTVWTGYSPQHMFAPGEGRGTITLRSMTMMHLLCDIGRSLIHHGFNRLLFVNGHGSNQKVIDPVLRKLKYETGALVGFVNPLMERYTGLMEGLLDNPNEETPGSHASELETCSDLAWDPTLVHMDRTDRARVHIPDFLPAAFAKSDGRPDVEFDGYTYFSFPMEYAEITDTGAAGNAQRATAEKGQEAFRRFSEHIARGVLELSKAPVASTTVSSSTACSSHERASSRRSPGTATNGRPDGNARHQGRGIRLSRRAAPKPRRRCPAR